MTLPKRPYNNPRRLKMSFLSDVRKIFRENIRDYGMFIALGVIWLIFAITTDGLFISSRNLVNLVNQTGYIAVLAVGMTLVIVIRHIDLSVGFLAGFLGAVAAIAMVSWNLPVWVVIPLIMVFGIIAGLVTSFLVAVLGIPAFVATLAGWLGYRGALQLVTRATGTIIIPNEAFNALGNGFIPDFPGLTFWPEIHKATLFLGLISIILYVSSAIRSRQKRGNDHIDNLPLPIFIFQLVFFSALIGGGSWILAGYQGFDRGQAVIVLVVVLAYDFIARRTVLGRHIYAVGGNPEAAELVVSVSRKSPMSSLALWACSALSGMLFAARTRSARRQPQPA
ncbi:MAG: sugar ABC transporter permease [Ardenticatenaceae bacterium]|nr:sugar ABC transporter permease [Ardenticatenaceae bacterium]